MRILCIGDIIGQDGVSMVCSSLPDLIKDYNIDFCIANCENLSLKRIPKDLMDSLLDSGVDVCTMGNHFMLSSELKVAIKDENYPIARPCNLIKCKYGNGFFIKQKNDKKIMVINALGRTFMTGELENPFVAIDKIIKENSADEIIVDFHAEATSEKVAMGFYLDGRVSAVVGTHTHIQTADERLLPKKTAYISDIGMCGAYNSVLGMDKDIIVKRFLTEQKEETFKHGAGSTQINAVVIDVGKSISRIFIK